MRGHSKSLIAAIALGCAFPLTAAPEASKAVNDARQLVECMKAFDAECVAGLIYERGMNDFGLSRAQMFRMLTDRYAELKSKSIRISRFDLRQPSHEFDSDGRRFVFIPYVQTWEIPGSRPLTFEAYLIGVSEDLGLTWTFVEGVKQTAETIRQLIPSFRDQPPLPPVSERRD